MDDHRIHIGDVQPRLDDRRGHKHVNLPVDKVIHDALQFVLLHPAVRKTYVCLRHQLLDHGRHIRDVVDPVIDIVDLSFSGKFPDDRLPHQFLIVFADKSLDGLPVPRRLLQHTHIPDSDQAHMQRPRDRRSR